MKYETIKPEVYLHPLGHVNHASWGLAAGELQMPKSERRGFVTCEPAR